MTTVEIDPKFRILQSLYEEFFNSNIAGLGLQNFMLTSSIPDNKLHTELEILESKWYIKRNEMNRYVITVNGINLYEKCLPPSEITRKHQERKLILEVLLPLYQHDIHQLMRYTELSKLTNITDHNYLLAIVEYLEQRGLVYLRVPLGGAFDIRLTTKGYQSLQDEITSNVTVMIAAYEILFKLENHTRRYIESKMRNKLGTDWWEKGLSDAVRSRAGNRKTNENKSGWDISVTSEESEYLLFEDLSKIIINNWDNVFKEDLHEQSKIILKLTELELIRHAIAHTRTLTLEGMTRLEQYSNELLRLTTH